MCYIGFMKKIWQLQEAKNRLSELIDNALHQGYQTITRHGEPTVVILSVKEFEKLSSQPSSIEDFFSNSPLQNVHLDLNRNKDLPREVHF